MSPHGGLSIWKIHLQFMAWRCTVRQVRWHAFSLLKERKNEKQKNKRWSHPLFCSSSCKLLSPYKFLAEMLIVSKQHAVLAEWNSHLAYISVRVSMYTPSIGPIREDECYYWDSDTFPLSSSRLLICTKTMRGRYVSIQRMQGLGDDQIALCEVAVWANLAPGWWGWELSNDTLLR